MATLARPPPPGEGSDGSHEPRAATPGWQIGLLVFGLLPAIAAALFFTRLGGIYQLVPETCLGEDCGWLARPLVAVNAVAQAAVACGALLLVTRRRPSFGVRLALVVLGAPAASAVLWYFFALAAQAS